MSDPQFNSVDTNSLESVGKGRKMTPKKKASDAWMDDGDSAHWVPTKSKAKKVSTPVVVSGRTEKYTGKGKTKRKITTKK